MPLQHETEERAAPRYDAETIRRATVLASRLQQEQKETLTREEAEALGAELGIDPQYMSRALRVVSRSRPQSAPRRQLTFAWMLGSAVAVALFGALRITRTATAALVPTPPVALVAPAGALVSNGGFEEVSPGRKTPRDWKVKHGDVEVVTATTGERGVRLGTAALIEQAVPTLPGRRYTARIRFRGTSTAEREAHFAQFRAAGFTSDLSCISGGPANEVWSEQHIGFAASDSVSRLQFETGPNIGPGGIVIDEVTVTELP